MRGYSSNMDPYKIIDKYYGELHDLRYVLLTHSEQVRNKALEVVDKHPDLGADRNFVSEASLLHDIGIFMTDAARIHCHGLSLYIQHGFLGAELLRQEGLELHARVSERHTGVGIALEVIRNRRLPLPLRDMSPMSIEEKIICYADKFYSKTELHKEHTLDRVLKSLSHHSPENALVFRRWHEQFL